MDTINFEDSGKLIRIGDNAETYCDRCLLSASYTISKTEITAEEALQNIKKNYKTILNDFPGLRIKFDKKDDIPYLYYSSDEELQFDNLVKIVDEPLEDGVPIPSPDMPTWRLQITPLEEKLKFKLYVLHFIIDARGLFELLDIFSSYALNRKLTEKLERYRNQPVLSEFGKKDWFTQEIIERGTDHGFLKDAELNDIVINPEVSLPSYSVTTQWNMDYAPISKFCRKHQVSPQSLMMAIRNESIRQFNKGKFDHRRVSLSYFVDCKSTKYATETLKNSLFFPHIGNIVENLEEEEDWLKNIKNCYTLLEKTMAGTKACDDLYHKANLRSTEGHLIAREHLNPRTIPVVSHLGLVGSGFEDIQFRMFSPVFPGVYFTNMYGYHNEKTFSLMFVHPNNIQEDYVETIKSTVDKYYDSIVKDIENDEEDDATLNKNKTSHTNVNNSYKKLRENLFQNFVNNIRNKFMQM